MSDVLARDIWRVLEPVHAVSYFADACIADRKALGLRGYWMGYFASRSAPLGAVGPGVIEATFYNFHPAMIRRAIPDAWTFVRPAEVLADRARSAAAVLRRTVPDIDEVAVRTRAGLRAAVTGAPTQGRALFAANRDLPEPEDPVEALWQAATALREHRGDGHVACLLAEGIDGCAAHVLFNAETGAPDNLWRDNRGWSEQDWAQAGQRLTERGLLADGRLTDAGRALRAHLEARTDALAMTAYHDVPDLPALIDALLPAAELISASGEVVHPSPLGADPALVGSSRPTTL